jgi:putative ABC transport system ATP-binding protein
MNRHRSYHDTDGGPVTATGFSVHLTGVSRTYRTGDAVTITAVDGVDLDLPAGDTAALTGPSGSGKSTLLHLLGAIDAPDTGTITIGGTDITSLDRRRLAGYRSTVGFVFQRFHLLPALSARDNVIAPVVPRRRRIGYDPAARAQELLDAVGLGDRASALPSQLSGGQQQRVAIARALINHPGLLLADEPTGNLDSATGQEIIDLILTLNAEHGTTLVIATHDLTIAAQCARVITMRDGSIAQGHPPVNAADRGIDNRNVGNHRADSDGTDGGTVGGGAAVGGRA